MFKNRGRPKKERPVAPKRPRKPKQPYLPGAEDLAPTTIAEVETLAENFVSARNAWQAMGLTMQDASAQLLAEMLSRHLTEYEYDGQMVKVESLQKVKVNKIKGEAANAESNGEAE